jgi:hypothetical protein
VDATGSGSCQMAGFGYSGFIHSDSGTKVLSFMKMAVVRTFQVGATLAPVNVWSWGIVW